MLASAGMVMTRAAVRAAFAQEPSPTPTNGQIFMPSPPTLSVQAVPAYGVAPLTVGFTVMANDPANIGFVYYKWNFGDGHVSTIPPPFALNTYTNPGSYIVTVTAVTEDGRTATATTGVIVRPQG